jgi:hypothetical protein
MRRLAIALRFWMAYRPHMTWAHAWAFAGAYLRLEGMEA